MRLLVLLCLLSLAAGSPGPEPGRRKRIKVTEAPPPTQIEPPEPETTEEPEEETTTTEESIYDLDYIVKRPSEDDNEDEDEDDDDSGEKECDFSRDNAGEGYQSECKGTGRTPYTKYKGYKNWKRRPLLVIVIGGLRWDYLTPSWWNMTEMAGDRLKAFEWIKKHGSTLGQVVPVFPPYDLPVWTSLATGLYPKNTGVVGDYMFNLDSRELFSLEDPEASLENWWLEGEPIWSLAAKHGRKVSVLNWHDCSLPGKQLENSEDCKPFDRFDKKKTRQMMVRMFNRAITKIVLDDYLEFNHTQYIIQRGGSCVLVPFALRAGDIMRGFPAGGKKGVANMQGVSAYVRDVNLEIPSLDYPEIPDDLEYGGLTWTQDILLVAKPGFEIVINTDSPKVLPPLNDDLGISGFIPAPNPPYIVPGREKHKSKDLRMREKLEVELYDLFSHMMKTIGFAWGPDFKPGFKLDNLEIVDLYQIMAFLLKIPPNQHDGNWDRVKKMLVLNDASSEGPSILMCLVSSLVILRFNH